MMKTKTPILIAPIASLVLARSQNTFSAEKSGAQRLKPSNPK
jgi:hypothetical protein